MSVDMKPHANAWIILLLMLFCFPLTCSQCFKRFASMDIRKFGYETMIVDVNECVEKSQRVYTTIPLYHNDANRPYLRARNDASPYFRWRHIGPCCCLPVSSSGVKKVRLTSLDGRSHLMVRYRRIDSCECVPCSMANEI